MRHQRPVVPFLVLSLACAALHAQGGRGGRGRTEEITNRVGAFFTDIAGPATDGDKVADLATCEMVRAATGNGQPTVLYLVDSGDDQDVRDQFERTVFGSDEIGIELRCFHCGRIDLAKSAPLKARFQKQAPLFAVIDKEGKLVETVAMNGYKASAPLLAKALERAGAGTVKPSLEAFAKEYGGLVRDLEQALAKKKLAQERQAKAGADKGKKAEADKDLEAATTAVDKVMDKEKALLAKHRLPERPANAVRLGGRAGPGAGGPGGRAGG